LSWKVGKFFSGDVAIPARRHYVDVFLDFREGKALASMLISL